VGQVLSIDKNTTALNIVSRKGRIETVCLLLKYDADINATNEKGNAPLYCASGVCGGESSLEIVRKLLDHGANTGIKNSNYETFGLDPFPS
jgi:ankyrin repeat protein